MLKYAPSLILYFLLAPQTVMAFEGQDCKVFANISINLEEVRGKVLEPMANDRFFKEFPDLHKLGIRLRGTAKVRNRGSEGELESGYYVATIDELVTNVFVSRMNQQSGIGHLFIDGEKVYVEYLGNFFVPRLSSLGKLDPDDRVDLFDKPSQRADLSEWFCRKKGDLFGSYQLYYREIGWSLFYSH